MRKLISFLIAAIVPTLIGLIYMIFEDDFLKLLSTLPQNTNKKEIVRIGLLSILLVILGMSYYLIVLKEKIKSIQNVKESKDALSPRFGVYWDKNKEAFCPSCKTLLSNYKTFEHSSGKTSYMYHCIKCDRMIPLNNGGTPITLDEAIKKLSPTSSSSPTSDSTAKRREHK